jgi:hypothetical protein
MWEESITASHYSNTFVLSMKLRLAAVIPVSAMAEGDAKDNESHGYNFNDERPHIGLLYQTNFFTKYQNIFAEKFVQGMKSHSNWRKHYAVETKEVNSFREINLFKYNLL